MRASTWLVIVGVGAWTAALLVGPTLRRDLDPVTDHPEAYAAGAWALVMQLGYVGVAVAGGVSAWLARSHPVAALLLAGFAVGALVIGLLPPGDGGVGDRIFPTAQLAPLAFFPAIAWISWRSRRPALLATAAVVWLLFVPLVLGDPPFGGILNRAADLGIGAWLALFAATSPESHAAGSLASS